MNLYPATRKGTTCFLYKDNGCETKAKQIAKEVLTENVKVYGFETYRIHRQLDDILK